MIPKDLISQAERLADLSPNKPKQVNLRRAISSAYYAVFHALCQSNASALVGTGSQKPEKAWSQCYRALDHGTAKKRCKDSASKGFPQEINDFSNSFVALQEYRHRADYNPDSAKNFSKQETLTIVGQARSAVKAISVARIKDRRAFAIHVLLPYRD